ncbi:UNVERIFIED_CONTAM: hypothetical protein Sindi_0367500 [Sesamum indicum]
MLSPPGAKMGSRVQDRYEGDTLFQAVIQSGIRKMIISASHDSAMGGHSGIHGTYQRRAKHENNPYPRLLYPLPISEQVGLAYSWMDTLTKYSHFLALKHPYSASRVAKFVGSFSRHASAYHPQSDGQTERVNHCLENYFKVHVPSTTKKVVGWLGHSIGSTPTPIQGLKLLLFQALYGYPPNQLCIGPYLQSHHTKVEELVQERMKMLQLLKDNLCKAEQRMKLFVDKHRSEKKFEVRDYVFLKLQPYRKISIALRRKVKLSARYYGPYEVVQRVGEVAYRLALPTTFRIHTVFHASCSLLNALSDRDCWMKWIKDGLQISRAQQEDTFSRDLPSASGEHVTNDLKGSKSSMTWRWRTNSQQRTSQ